MKTFSQTITFPNLSLFKSDLLYFKQSEYHQGPLLRSGVSPKEEGDKPGSSGLSCIVPLMDIYGNTPQWKSVTL